MRTQNVLRVVVVGGLLCGSWGSGFGAPLDDTTAKAIITQSADNVLAALVQVETTCHREDPLCMDGVRVVQVLLERNPLGARLAPGARLVLHVGRGDDPGIPQMGDQVLFVGSPLNPKSAQSDYTAKGMTVSPSRKDVDELRSVISSLASPGGTPSH